MAERQKLDCEAALTAECGATSCGKRKNRMIRWPAFVAVLTYSIGVSLDTLQAGAVPSALFNKTIALTWNIQMSVKNAGGTVKTFAAPRERVVYISDKGRLFVRERRPDGRGALNQVEERASGNSTNYTGNPSSIRFEGDELVAITGQVNGANMMRASFDQSFSNCSMRWMAGKSASGQTTWKGSDGVSYDIVSATAGAMSCSIKSGNAFAN
jgi:hypothetical protein